MRLLLTSLLSFLLLINGKTANGQDIPATIAEIQPSSTIIVRGEAARAARSVADYALYGMDGTTIGIAQVLPRRSNEILIIPDRNLDVRRLHRLVIAGTEDPILGVDGFRIDLAGQIDEQTLRWIKDELPEDLIIYGEAWIAPTDPVTRNDPDLYWYKADAPITYFQDHSRNAFKGGVHNPEDRIRDRGFAGGDGSVRERAMLGLTNGFEEEIDPNRGINYLDIHDNWALADQFSDVDWDGRRHVDEAGVRLAATLLFTSLGPVAIHGGTEFLRTKGSAPLEETVKEFTYGKLYFHGKRDTYNHRRANQFEWEFAGAAPGERPMDYAAMNRYWKDLIALRASDAGSVFRKGGTMAEDHYQWILPEDDRLLGYVVGGKVLVLMNASWDEAGFDLSVLPEGRWKQLTDGTSFAGSSCSCDQVIETGSTDPILMIPARSAPIWVLDPN